MGIETFDLSHGGAVQQSSAPDISVMEFRAANWKILLAAAHSIDADLEKTAVSTPGQLSARPPPGTTRAFVCVHNSSLTAFDPHYRPKIRMAHSCSLAHQSLFVSRLAISTSRTELTL